MNSCIDHGFAFNPDEESCSGILDEELVEIDMLVYCGVCKKWWTCGDWGGEEWEVSLY